MRAIIFIASLSMIACAGNKGKLRMDELAYPVSMSGYIYDKNMKPVRIDAGLKKLAHIETSKTLWSMFYTLVNLNDATNIVRDFNGQIAETKTGQGVVNLNIRHRSCFLNEFYILNLLPIWPGCSTLILSGDVIEPTQ